jgi:glycine dehydrogenase subunit 1
MRYLPNTAQNQRAMLETIGVGGVEDLLVKIPAKARLARPLALPPALAESDLVRHMRTLAARNADADSYACFLGAGAYDHYVPSPINHLIMRGEFFTAYTPYQPEASQGTLRTIYEYQTMIAELTGMDVANASIYDGGSSLAEACLMAASINGRTEIALTGGLNPLYHRVVETYVDGPGLKLREVPAPEGVIDLDAARRVVGAKTAALVVQSPNFYGCLEDVAAAAELAHAAGALLVVASDPVNLGVLEAPGRQGADIVVGEGQGLGVPLSFGGPYLGVLMATIYVATLGKQGLVRVGELSAAKAHYAAERLGAVPGVSLRFAQPFFKEFTLKLPKPPDRVAAKLAKQSILAGLPLKTFDRKLSDCLLVAVTERRTKDEIDAFADALAKAVA